MATDGMVLLSYWQQVHQQLLGQPYMTEFGKDNVIMKSIVGVYGIEKTKRMIDFFFGRLMTDPFLQQTGATVGVFKTQIAKLVLDLSTEVVDKNIGKL